MAEIYIPDNKKEKWIKLKGHIQKQKGEKMSNGKIIDRIYGEICAD